MALPVFKTGCCPLAGQAGFDSQALPPRSRCSRDVNRPARQSDRHHHWLASVGSTPRALPPRSRSRGVGTTKVRIAGFESRKSNYGGAARGWATWARIRGAETGWGVSDAGPKGRGRSGSNRLTSENRSIDRSIRYSIKRISPARGPFCESSGVNSTRCPSRSSSNTVPRTELRWKKCSRPDSSRMNPNPLSMRSRAIVPVGIPVSSASESLRTSQELPHPQIPVVSDNEARTMAGAGERGNGNRRQV